MLIISIDERVFLRSFSEVGSIGIRGINSKYTQLLAYRERLGEGQEHLISDGPELL